MYFSKSVLAALAAVFLVLAIGFAIELTKANNLSSQKSALKAEVKVLKTSSTSSSQATQLQNISTQIAEILKNQMTEQSEKQKEAASTTTATQTLQKQLEKQNTTAQSNVRTALKDAQSVYAQSKTYSKFTSAAAALIEPSLQWTNGTSTGPSTISIVKANGPNIQLCALSDSGSFFCISEEAKAKTVTYGTGWTQVAALKALASDGWSTTNTTGQELPYKNGG